MQADRPHSDFPFPQSGRYRTFLFDWLCRNKCKLSIEVKVFKNPRLGLEFIAHNRVKQIQINRFFLHFSDILSVIINYRKLLNHDEVLSEEEGFDG